MVPILSYHRIQYRRIPEYSSGGFTPAPWKACMARFDRARNACAAAAMARVGGARNACAAAGVDGGGGEGSGGNAKASPASRNTTVSPLATPWPLNDTLCWWTKMLKWLTVRLGGAGGGVGGGDGFDPARRAGSGQ